MSRRNKRALAEQIYERTKTQPWSSAHYIDKVRSPTVETDGIKLSLCVSLLPSDGRNAYGDPRFWSWLKVEVLVDGSPIYPGGEYTLWWEFWWEWDVYRRIVNKDDIDVIPCTDRQLNLIETLKPAKKAGKGDLSVIED